MRYCNNGGCMGAQPGYMPSGMNRARRAIDSEYPIAMAYVPWQQWRKLHDLGYGFQCGTIFQELEKPFRGKGGCCK